MLEVVGGRAGEPEGRDVVPEVDEVVQERAETLEIPFAGTRDAGGAAAKARAPEDASAEAKERDKVGAAIGGLEATGTEAGLSFDASVTGVPGPVIDTEVSDGMEAAA